MLFRSELVTESHLRFKDSVRYPRLVASHFGTFEMVSPHNGGSNTGAVEWWTNSFNTQNTQHYSSHRPSKIHKDEIGYVVFQLTQWQRDNFEFEIDGEKHNIPFHCTHQDQYREKFFKWLDLQQLSLESWIQQYIQGNLDKVKALLQDCEAHGMKTLIFTWPSDYFLLFIDKDPWLKERFLTFDYKGINYKSIEDLMSPSAMHTKGYNPELTIKWDEESFEVTPKDHHPSLKCHEVMAENIINRIEKDMQK